MPTAIATKPMKSKIVEKVAQNEITLSDAEILRRVSLIRNNWSVAERAERRREAERRFNELLNKLTAA